MMIIKNIPLFFCIAALFTACVGNKEKEAENAIVLRQKNGIIQIHIDSFKGQDIRQIELIGHDNFNQRLELDSNFKISVIRNEIDLPEKEDYVNTWITLDRQGNMDIQHSYDYLTNLLEKDGQVFVECIQVASLISGSKKYILLGNYSDHFELKSGEKPDTIPFDHNNVALVPLKKYKMGNNNIKFIIVETNKQKIRSTYVDKDFYIN